MSVIRRRGGGSMYIERMQRMTRRRKRRHASYNKMASKVKISTHTRESLGKEGRRLAHECPESLDKRRRRRSAGEMVLCINIPIFK